MGTQTCLIVEDIEESLKWLQICVNRALQDVECETATTFKTATGLIDNHNYDIALIDLSLPDGNGLDLIKRIKKKSPDTIVTVVTIHDDDKNIFTALRNGANGYLLKDVSSEIFVEQIKGIISGVPPLSPAIAIKLIDYFSIADEEDVALTNREQEVLIFIAKGMSSRQVSEYLGITQNTVLSYIKTIYRKLGISSRAEASLEAHRRGLM